MYPVFYPHDIPIIAEETTHIMPFYSHQLCFGKTQMDVMDVIQLTNSASSWLMPRLHSTLAWPFSFTATASTINVLMIS